MSNNMVNRVGKKYRQRYNGSVYEIVWTFPDGLDHVGIYKYEDNSARLIITEANLVKYYEEIVPKFEVGKTYVFKDTGEQCTVLYTTASMAFVRWDNNNEGTILHSSISQYHEA